jgi:hypothetical protein
MSFAMSILCLFLGCCLMWVAVHGTEASTPWGVYQEITGALSGNSAGSPESGREESATVGGSTTDPTAGRTNEPAGPE